METAPRVVLLAAGASERLGEPKALVELGGASALDRLLSACGEDSPLVIAGAHYEEIVSAAGDRAQVIRNSAWAAGRTGSVARAVEHLGTQDLIIAPADCPLVPARVFDALREAWLGAGAPARGWLAPLERGSGKHGHPICIGRGLAQEVAGMDPAEPLRHLRKHADPLLEVALDAPEVLDDLDTPEDLARLRARL